MLYSSHSSVGAVLISLIHATEPVGGYIIESVMHTWCDARPAVTFPAADHFGLLTGIKLYCLVTHGHKGVNNLLGVVTPPGV